MKDGKFVAPPMVLWIEVFPSRVSTGSSIKLTTCTDHGRTVESTFGAKEGVASWIIVCVNERCDAVSRMTAAVKSTLRAKEIDHESAKKERDQYSTIF